MFITPHWSTITVIFLSQCFLLALWSGVVYLTQSCPCVYWACPAVSSCPPWGCWAGSGRCCRSSRWTGGTGGWGRARETPGGSPSCSHSAPSPSGRRRSSAWRVSVRGRRGGRGASAASQGCRRGRRLSLMEWSETWESRDYNGLELMLALFSCSTADWSTATAGW